jgi:hypothetical protein
VIKNNLKRIGAIVLFAIAMGSCKDKNMEEEFDWSGNISAPKEYPMEVYKGYLSGGGHFFGFSEMGGLDNSGWGMGTSGMSEIHAPVPDTLVMTWRSLVERKFYTGTWTLPKERMKQLFKEGIVNEKPFSVIQLGLAPKGVLVVWLYGQGGQIEVGRFQGHETTIDPKEAYDNAKYMFEADYIDDMLANEDIVTPEIKEKIKQDGYPLLDVYDTYREKYLWIPKVILPEGCKITSVNITMCNGEFESIPLPQKKRAIPYEFEIFWTNTLEIDKSRADKAAQDYVCRIAFTGDQKYWEKYLIGGDDYLPLDFDKNEIRILFKDKIDKNVPAEMVIKIDPTQKDDDEWVTNFYLEQAGKQYPIKEIIQDSGKY